MKPLQALIRTKIYANLISIVALTAHVFRVVSPLLPLTLCVCVSVWYCLDVGDGPDYRVLLAHFGHVISVFKQIKPEYQTVIADITKKMGAGMAEFAEKKNVKTNSDYNLYCHYVAGLVGHGLTRLFGVSGLESMIDRSTVPLCLERSAAQCFVLSA